MKHAPTPDAGMTLPEVLIAMVVISLALVSLVPMLAKGPLAVTAGGSVSKATAYASQLMERVRNQPVTSATNLVCPNTPNPDYPELGITRTCTIAGVGTTTTPNRLWRVTVTVTVNQTAGTAGSPGITLETMRAE